MLEIPDYPEEAGLLPVAVEMEEEPRWRLRPEGDQVLLARKRGGDARLLLEMTFRTRAQAERASFYLGQMLAEERKKEEEGVG